MKLLIIVAVLLAGCEYLPTDQDIVSRDAAPVCVGGVVYYRFHKSIAPAFNPDSTIRTCPSGVVGAVQ